MSPRNDEGPALATPAPQEQTSRHAPDSADSHESLQQAAREKRLSNAQAELALGGIALHELRSGAFLLVCPGFVAHLTDVEAVEAWARRARA